VIEGCFAQRVLFRVRVVNDKQVRTTTSDCSAHTSSKVFAAFVSTPFARTFVVLLEAGSRKDVPVMRVVDQIPHLAAKPNSQFRVVGGLNDLELRVSAQKPRWHEVAGELRLGMTRRHVDNQPL
jgi:hypothetical protein